MTDENIHTWRDWMRGAWRSWTIRFAALLAALPDILALVQTQFSSVAPYIPDALESRVLNLVALVIFVLRVRTTAALPHR